MGALSHSSRVRSVSTRPQSILLVDSNQLASDGLARLLRMIYGPLVVIRQCPSGRQALATLKSNSFELVLIDYRLPDIDGLELLSQVLDGVDQTAILLMTDQPSDRLAAEALRQGAMDYFVKHDVGPAELEQLITQALRTVRLEHRQREATQQWRLDHTERSDQVRALSDDMNIHMARLERWVRHVSHTSTDTATAGEGLRHISSELRQLQRVAADLSKLANGSDRDSSERPLASHSRS